MRFESDQAGLYAILRYVFLDQFIIKVKVTACFCVNVLQIKPNIETTIPTKCLIITKNIQDLCA